MHPHLHAIETQRAQPVGLPSKIRLHGDAEIDVPVCDLREEVIHAGREGQENQRRDRKCHVHSLPALPIAICPATARIAPAIVRTASPSDCASAVNSRSRRTNDSRESEGGFGCARSRTVTPCRRRISIQPSSASTRYASATVLWWTPRSFASRRTVGNCAPGASVPSTSIVRRPLEICR